MRHPDGGYCGPIDTCSLTFDDGPDPVWTPRILDCLAGERAPSTFFVMTGRARRGRDLIARMLGEGHEVELHCVRHLRHTDLDEAALRRDTEEGLRTLGEIGASVRRWRPPWGVVTAATRRVAAEHQLELVGWTADPEDWAGHRAPQMHGVIAREIRPGAVVLLHDGLGPGARRRDCAQTVELLPRLLATMRGRGLRAAPLSGNPG